jgi:hypothetical protein
MSQEIISSIPRIVITVLIVPTSKIVKTALGSIKQQIVMTTMPGDYPQSSVMKINWFETVEEWCDLVSAA